MKITFSLLLFGLIILALRLTAQEVPAIHYGMKEGIGGSSVAEIYQDNKGHMWLATLGGGITRFDGRHFFTLGQQHGLEVELTRAVVQSSEGTIYVGTFGSGVYKLDRDTLIRVFADTLPKEIFSLAADKHGAIYVGGDIGLYKILPNQSVVNLTVELDLIPGPITYISVDKKGDIWFNYDEYLGVYHLSNGAIAHHFDSLSGLTSGRILSTFHDRNQITWICTHEGIYRVDNEIKKCHKISAAGLPNYYVFNMAELPTGELVMGTQDRGIVFYQPQTNTVTRAYDSNKGLKNQVAFRVFVDDENNVWVSSWGEGVSRLMLSGWEKYAAGNGLAARLIYDILPFNKQWLVATPNGLYVIHPDNKAQPIFRSKIAESVMTIYQVGDELLCAKERSLTVINTHTETVKSYDQPAVQGIKSITQSKDGAVYLASWGGGITTYKKGTFVSVDDTLVQSVSYLYCAYTDTQGNIWFGSWEAGVLKYDGKKWSQLTAENDLPSNKVTSITEDSKGRIIIGTNGGGIAILDGEQITYLNSTTIGLPNHSIFSLHCDKKDRLWIGLQGSIGVYDLSTNRYMGYDAKHGFDGDAMLNAMAESKDGMWVGTNNYLWHFDDTKQVNTQLSLRVFFKEIVVNGASITNQYEYTYDQNKLLFSFYSTQISRADEVQFSYRLLGIQEEFSTPSNQTEVSLLELPHGAYTFEVKACLDGTCGETESYFFIIHPPFWKTWWFLLMVVVLSGLTVWGYIHWRERKLKEKQRILEETVALRTKEIAHQKEIVEERNKEITDSINYAKRLQDAILPPRALWFSALPESFVLFLPKDIVAGDFYWMHTFEEQSARTVLFAAADCTGHGVPGAMVSVVCSNALNRAVKEFNLKQPDVILNKVRELVIETFEKSENQVLDGMDISLAALKTINEANEQHQSSSQTLFWAGANNPLWIIRNEATELEEFKPDKQPIGNYGEQKPFTLHTITVQKGDVFYLFSDGYQDQFGGEKGKKFKAAELKKLLLQIRHIPMEEQQIKIQQVFEQWRGGLEQVDDVCIIGVRV